jgi:homoserine dehydrogenase
MGGRVWRVCLAGAGNVGGGLLRMLAVAGPDLERRYGVCLRVTGVAELGGAAVDPDGLDVTGLCRTLADRKPLGGLPRVGVDGLDPVGTLAASGADILLEATPVNLSNGQPGLDTVLAALAGGVHAVLANKAPLALAYARLAALSDLGNGWRTGGDGAGQDRPLLRFSATAAGALPVINIGRRDLAGSRITRLEAILNGTTHWILRAMQAGQTFAHALADAQRRGIAEADPGLDIDGHDAACKLVIVANAVLDQPTTLADVEVTGIRQIGAADVLAADHRGERLVLLCLAEWTGNGYRLSVAPSPVDREHPLARITPDEMGAVFYCDNVDRISVASLEPGAEPASSAMLRDVLDIVRVGSPRR